MSSAKKRLGQVSSHVQGSQAAEQHTTAGIRCTTVEHSPGHNVATIVFSNPAKLNVASKSLLDQLIRVCEELSKDEALRAVVFTGGPPNVPGKTPAFIGGADIQELHQISSADEARKYIIHVHNACAALQNLPVPVIARVHGFALGAGLELMVSCDLKVATKASKFGMPEVKIGLPSVIDAALFPGLIGMGRTKQLVYLAENISADVARDWGLIERVVNDEAELDRAVDEWIGKIVAMGPKSIRNQKKLMRKWEIKPLQEAVQAGVDSLAEAYKDGGKEAKEYMKPFLGRKN